MKSDYPRLFAPGRIGSLELKNRIVIPAMELAFGDEKCRLNDRMRGYYEARAKGGAGLIMVSGMAIGADMCGITVPGQIVLNNEKAVSELKELADMFHSYDCKVFAQILHPGRQGQPIFNNNETPVAPSAIPEGPGYPVPRELSTEEVQLIISRFIRSAELALSAGVDGIEIHAAHGYLPYQFMAKRANKRTDQYGGSFENRMRFITEIAEGVNKFKGDKVLSIRFNGTDWHPVEEGGMSVEDGVEVAKYLEKIGFDCLNVSGGSYSTLIRADEGYLYPEACRNWVKAITEAVNVPVISVNHIKSPELAEKTLEDGVCDFLALARANIADPNYVNKLAEGREDHIRRCIGCCQCLQSTMDGHAAYCSMNPCMGREYLYNEKTFKPTGNGRHVVVLGGGPGGLMAAITAAQRGFKVTLLDDSDSLGGSMKLASKGTGKDKVAKSLKNLINDAEELGVTFCLNTNVEDVETIKALNPYAVVVATGGNSICPNIPGINGANVTSAHEVLRTLETNPLTGKTIALVGTGMTGIETADLLMRKGNQMELFDMIEEPAAGVPMWNRFAFVGALQEGGAHFHMQNKLLEITENSVITENIATGEKAETSCDLVVLSLGVTPKDELYKKLSGEFDKVFNVGDSAGGGKIMDATREAFMAMWDLD